MAKQFYGVTMAEFAWVYVEADSPEEAMKIAKNRADDIQYLDEIEEQIQDSNMEVHSCEVYPSEVDELEDNTIIITKEGEIGRVDELYEEEDDE